MDGTATTLEPPSSAPVPHGPNRRPLVIGAVALGAAALIAVGSYAIGSNNNPTVHRLSGTAYVGADQATVRVDGWAYGITPGIPWLRGVTQHDSTQMPSCLRSVGSTQHITFGAVSFAGPSGGTWRQVVWVRCPR